MKWRSRSFGSKNPEVRGTVYRGAVILGQVSSKIGADRNEIVSGNFGSRPNWEGDSAMLPRPWPAA